MSPKLASMAEGVVFRFAADNGRGLSEVLKSSLAGVTQAPVPSSRGRSGDEDV
jgi:hypothetical protein